MLYEAYVKKVTRWVDKKNAVMKYKVPIIIALCVIFAAIAGFIATKGMLIGGLECPSEVTYGSGAPMNAKALFGKPYYEYAAQGSNAWSTEIPSGVGSFKVRAVSDRSFGFKSYSNEFAFVVRPVKVTVTAAGDQITYGSEPTASGTLQYEDRFEAAKFRMSSKVVGTSRVSAVADTIKVVDKNGNDVTSAYVFETPEKTLEIIPRIITIQLHDAEKEYDGRALTCGTYEKFDDQLIDGHRGYITLNGQRTEAGVTMNTVSSFKVLNGSKNVTSNYDFITVGGALTVTPRKITVMTGSKEGVYNGKVLTSNVCSVTEGALLRSHTLNVAGLTEAFDVGTYDNVLDVRVVDKNNRNVDATANYEITYQHGKLTVTPRSITMMPKMIVREYDGMPLYTNEATVTASSLGEGDTVMLETTGSITEVGTVSNSITDYTILHGTIDVTGNYEVKCLESSLTVVKRAIAVKPLDVEREYDATVLTGAMPEVVAGSIAPGQVMLIETDGSITDVGTRQNNIKSYKIFAGGEDVTENYNVITRSGRLTVKKRALTLTAQSATKVYDATPLVGPDYSITAGSVVPGQTLTVSVAGLQTDAGESENRIASWRITAEGGKDVSANYSVTLEAGLLKVEPRPITITSASATKMYDGTSLAAPTYELSEGTLAVGHRVIAVVIGEQTSAGIGVNTIDSVSIVDADGLNMTENYNVTLEQGELKVLPRAISVRYRGIIETYTGKMIYTDEVTVVSSVHPLDGHRVIVAAGSERAGTYTFDECVGYIMTEDGSLDESSNYEIKIVGGENIVIMPFYVMIKPADAQREYDGTPLTSNTAEILDPKELPDGHTVEITTSGSVTDVIYRDGDAMPLINRITSIVIKNGKGEDVTDSFSVMTQVGTLTVHPRTITLKPKDEVKEYDGTPLLGNTPECSVGSIADGQTAFIVTKGAQLEIGSSENVIVEYMITDASMNNVMQNYRITIEKGTLTVTQRALVIAPVDVEKMYDGMPLIAFEAMIKEGSLLEHDGHSFKADVQGERTDAGITASVVIENSLKIVDRNGEDVSSIYSVVFAEGTVTVTPRPITVMFNALTKVYDGKVLTSDKYIITSALRPLMDHTLMIESLDDDAGTYGADGYKISVLANGVDMTENYEITHDGVITINKRTVFFAVDPAEKAFDSTALRVEGLKTAHGTTLVAGHVAHAVTASASPGVYVWGEEDRNFAIFIYSDEVNADLESTELMDVTANYDIKLTKDPTFTIHHRTLTVDVKDVTRIYDATAIFDATVLITEGQIADGHSFVHKNIGSSVVGVYSGLLVSDLRVLDAEGNDITAYYNITFTGEQKFSVETLPRPVAVKPFDTSKYYDGTSSFDATDEGFMSADSSLIEGHKLVFFGTESDLGTQTVNAKDHKIYNELGEDITGCYDISFEVDSFELATVRRAITIRPSTVSRPYNGLPLYGGTKADVVSDLPLLPGHTLTVTTKGSQTDIGDGVLAIESYVIMDAEGNDVTGHYDVSCVNGAVKVLRVSLVLATSDASAAYTGNALSARGITVFIGELLPGHVIYDADAEYAEVTNVGTYSNTVQGIKIHDDSGKDVTNMYNISYKYGTLTITSDQ